MTGHTSHLSGLAAEDAVERLLVRRGYSLAARRWRGSAGEVDLVMRQGGCIVFIEVKKARTHAIAAGRLGRHQMERIYAAASEFIAGEATGQNTDVRFDVALVDATGRVELVENAFAD